MHEDPIEGARRRLGALADALGAVAREPGAVEELYAAVEHRDPERFAGVPGRVGLPVPPELCDPYVTVLLFSVSPPRAEEVCRWTGPGGERPALTLDTTARDDLASAVDSDRLLSVLKALGLITCRTVLCPGALTATEVRVFRQGVCPPGTY